MIEYKNITQAKELWEIFLQECKDHINSFSEMQSLMSSSGIDLANQELQRKLSSRLHRLKGSLGFLGFKEFAESIKHIEDQLKSSEYTSIHEHTSEKLLWICNELQEMVNELELLVGK